MPALLVYKDFRDQPDPVYKVQPDHRDSKGVPDDKASKGILEPGYKATKDYREILGIKGRPDRSGSRVALDRLAHRDSKDQRASKDRPVYKGILVLRDFRGQLVYRGIPGHRDSKGHRAPVEIQAHKDSRATKAYRVLLAHKVPLDNRDSKELDSRVSLVRRETRVAKGILAHRE